MFPGLVRIGGLVCGLALAHTGGASSDEGRTEQRAEALLRQAIQAQRNDEFDRAGDLLDSAMAMAGSANNDALRARVLTLQGSLSMIAGERNQALSQYLNALRIHEQRQDTMGMAEIYNNIGSIHHYEREYVKASWYYQRSLMLRQAKGGRRDMGKVYNNLGSLLEEQGKLDSALYWHQKALTIWRSEGDVGWQAITYSNMAECFLRATKLDSARSYLERSLVIRRKLPRKQVVGHILSRLGEVEIQDGHPTKGVTYCEEALRIAQDLVVPMEEQAACECLSKAHEAMGRMGPALRYFRRAVELRDSLFSTEQARAITRIEMGHLFEQQQLADSLRSAKDRLQTELAYMAGINHVRNTRNLFIFWSTLVVVAALGLWSRLRYMHRSSKLLQQERDRNQDLLHNILPKPVAHELLLHGKARAQEYEQATILFTDFHNFTQFTEQVSAQELVATIDACFSGFDTILERLGVEKIKTVGDAYVAAGGLPEPGRCSAACVVRAAIAMQRFMERHRRDQEVLGRPVLSMRIGIHTGPVVAGVVGQRKFAYDIWGDTVNTAARLESCGEVGRVNISEATYVLVMDETDLRFIPRGMVHAKGKGELQMYFAERAVAEPELSTTPGM